MYKKDILNKAEKDKEFKKFIAHEIIKRMTPKHKEIALEKFNEKYKDHKDYKKLLKTFKKDINYEK